ncbi:MAG: serine hydroxymethyltransferase [Candidatus Andersenbacteria bacterium]
MSARTLATTDPELAKLIQRETERQRSTLTLIASENYPSRAVLEAVGSILTAKYAEGYPGARYYGGNEIIDEIEELARRRAVEVFGGQHVNVQSYSGSPANLAVYLGLLNVGDTILGMSLTHGGHLTHGHKVSASGKLFNAVHYGVGEDGLIDYDEVRRVAREAKPKLIVSGATAYPRVVDHARFQEIAQEVGALHLADVSHVAGLIAGDVYPNPTDVVDVLTTTTHKTLRGPRAAMIFCKADYAKKIDKAVFPGLQGGPHLNAIAGVAVALKEATSADFTTYAKRVVDNAKALASELIGTHGFNLLTGGTDSHLVLIDLRSKDITGALAEQALGKAGITVNKNTIPNETRSPFDPSGVRLGTPAVTTRGAEPKHMADLATWIADAVASYKDNKMLAKIRREVEAFASDLPLPGVD